MDVTDPAAANSPQSVLVVLQALPATIVSTHSFTNHATRGTHPATLTTSGGTITVDMTSLPAGTTVYRAMLVPHLSGNTGSATSSRANARDEDPVGGCSGRVAAGGGAAVSEAGLHGGGAAGDGRQPDAAAERGLVAGLEHRRADHPPGRLVRSAASECTRSR